jgi:hypothetical protein
VFRKMSLQVADANLHVVIIPVMRAVP